MKTCAAHRIKNEQKKSFAFMNLRREKTDFEVIGSGGHYSESPHATNHYYSNRLRNRTRIRFISSFLPSSSRQHRLPYDVCISHFSFRKMTKKNVF